MMEKTFVEEVKGEFYTDRQLKKKQKQWKKDIKKFEKESDEKIHED